MLRNSNFVALNVTLQPEISENTESWKPIGPWSWQNSWSNPSMLFDVKFFDIFKN